jgi:hypothetical protein
MLLALLRAPIYCSGSFAIGGCSALPGWLATALD